MSPGPASATAVSAPLDPDTVRALDLLPKVELHCHVEGTMRPGTVLDLARRNGIPLPTDDVTMLYRYGSLDEFLAVFWLVQSVLGDRGDWARLAYESAVDGAAHGRVYAETFVTPARHLDAGQSLGDVLAGLDEGFAAAEQETGAVTRVVVDADRAYGGGAAVQLVDELGALLRAGAPGASRVIGFGMDSTELGVDPLEFRPAYETARALGLHLTGHQGENSPPSAIATILDHLGVERVDHGLSVLGDEALVARMAAERIPLTVCPTSNILIANAFPTLTDHPFAAMRAAGLLATLNTDDPAMTDLDLGKEYAAVAGALGLDWDAMVGIALDGVAATWLDDPDKSALRARVLEAAAALRPGPAGSGEGERA